MKLTTPEEFKAFFMDIAVRWYQSHPEADQSKTSEQMYIDYIKSFGHDGHPASKGTRNGRKKRTPGKSQKSRGKTRLE